MSLALIHSSIVTPLGADINLVHLSAQAGIKPFENTAFFGKNGPRIKSARIPKWFANLCDHIDKYPQGLSPFNQRLFNLATLSLLDLRKVIQDTPLAAFVCTDPSLLRPPSLHVELIPSIAHNTGITLDPEHSFVSGAGRFGLAQCLDRAQKYVEATQAPYVLIGCLDSLIEPTRLLKLSKAGRLISPEANFASRYTHSPAMGGVIPSEAVVWLIFASKYAHLSDNRNYLYLTDNVTHISSRGSLNQREGMTAAFDQLRKQYGASQALLSCETGEAWHNRDLQVACLQHRDYIDAACYRLRLCDWLGDVGAAAPALALVLAERLALHQVTIAGWDERQSANALQFTRPPKSA